MTNENNPGVFGPAHTFDPTTWESRQGKSVMMNQLVQQHMRMSSAQVEAIIGNCTTNIPLKVKDATIFMPPGTNMCADYSAFTLTDAEFAKVLIIDKASR